MLTWWDFSQKPPPAGIAPDTARCVPRGRCGCGRIPAALAGFPTHCGSTLVAHPGTARRDGPARSRRGRADCPHPPAPPHSRCGAAPGTDAVASAADPAPHRSLRQSRPAATPRFPRCPATGWAGVRPTVSCRSQGYRSASNVWHITPHGGSLYGHPLLHTRTK